MECPKCKQKMGRKTNHQLTEKRRKQAYYFTEWDYCKDCKITQYSEIYKVWNADMDTREEFVAKVKRNQAYTKELRIHPTKAEMRAKVILENAGIDAMFQKGFISNGFHCIVDFYIPKPHKLCIEIDGSIHLTDKQISRDYFKDKYLKEVRKMKVVRFTNDDVFNRPEYMVDKINKIINPR